MSQAETLYTFRNPYPDYLERGRTQSVSLAAYRDGALVAPTSGTFALWEPDEDEDDGTALDSGSVTVTSSIATYSLTSTVLASTLDFGRGYREIWTLVFGSGASAVTRSVLREAALCRRAPYPVITDLDLDPDGSLAAQRSASVTSFQVYLDEAWRQVLGQLEATGNWPERIWNSSALRTVHRHKTLELVYRAFARTRAQPWLELAESEAKAYAYAWRTPSSFYADVDQDGRADDPYSLTPMGRGVVFGSCPGDTRYRFGGLG